MRKKRRKKRRTRRSRGERRTMGKHKHGGLSGVSRLPALFPVQKMKNDEDSLHYMFMTFY